VNFASEKEDVTLNETVIIFFVVFFSLCCFPNMSKFVSRPALRPEQTPGSVRSAGPLQTAHWISGTFSSCSS
jgi:hypothetical protein